MDKKAGNSHIINFSHVRNSKIEEKRRKYERTLFKNILGVYCVAEGVGLKAVELVDMSAEGLSFQLPEHSKNLSSVQVGKNFIFRFYFSKDTYIPVSAKILNQRECIENGSRYIRFGCSLDQSFSSFETYQAFVQFLMSYAENAQTDKGDLKLFYF